MTPSEWRRIKDFLAEALDVPPADRAAWLDTHCDPALRPEVERLLQEHDAAGSFLSSTPESLSPQAAEPRAVFQEGDLVAGRYRIFRRLGQGGLGQVYEADDLELGNRIALKIVHPRGEDPVTARQLIRAEIQAARKVTHANVCRIYDFGEHNQGGGEPVYFLTMELLEGETLGSRLRRGGSLSPAEALPLILQIAAALDAAHSAGIIHRDLKPQNVMLAPGVPRAVVMDFGLALASSSSTSPGEEPARLAGTPAWMAPEQLAGEPPHPAADVFAFGLLIARMTGAHPGDLSRLPPQWRPVLKQCFERDPARRPRSAGEVARALAPRVRRRWWPAAALITVAALVALFVWYRLVPGRAQSLHQLPVKGDWSSITPDGRWLVGAPGDGNLALREIATGKVRPLTNKKGFAAWGGTVSPDGTRIAFCWGPYRGPFDLRVIGTDGHGERVVWSAPDVRSCSLHDWSPSGKELLLLFQGADDQYRWLIVPAGGGQAEEIHLGRSARSGALFLTDQVIAFSILRAVPGATNWDIDVYDRVSRRTRPLVQDPADDYLLAISPDRGTLVFERDSAVWKLPVPRGVPGTPKMLRSGLGWITGLGVDRDLAFYYQVHTGKRQVMLARFEPEKLQVASKPELLTGRMANEGDDPSWSPDGKLLACLVGEKSIGIYSVGTRRWREVFVDLGAMSRPQWWTADALVAQGVSPTGELGHHRIDAVTGDTSLAVHRDESGTGFEGAWSPDGKLMFNRFYLWYQGLFRWDIAHHKRTMLYVPQPGEMMGQENLALSPDGKTLAFQLIEEKQGLFHLMVIPTAGGKPRKLRTVKRPETFRFHGFTWFPDSRRLLVALGPEAKTRLEAVNLADGTSVPVGPFPAIRAHYIRLSPDGRWLAFVHATALPGTETWVMRNALR